MDVIGTFEDALKKGATVPQATSVVVDAFAPSLSDEDEASLVWLGIADAQWTYGKVSADVVQRVCDDIRSGRGMDRWFEADRKRRSKALDEFAAKIAVPNPKPKKTPKIIVRPPRFHRGDCLAVRLENNLYGGAYVLATDHSQREYGKDLVVMLDYMSDVQPDLGVFRSRAWLKKTHHAWQGQLAIAWYLHVGFRSVRKNLEVVGNIVSLSSDPRDCPTITSWENLRNEIVLQREWDAGSGAR